MTAADDLRALSAAAIAEFHRSVIVDLIEERDRLLAVAEAADKVWRCKRCNGGGMVAPGDCCPTCAGDGLRVEWADDGSDLRPLVEAFAALDAEAQP